MDDFIPVNVPLVDGNEESEDAISFIANEEEEEAEVAQTSSNLSSSALIERRQN